MAYSVTNPHYNNKKSKRKTFSVIKWRERKYIKKRWREKMYLIFYMNFQSSSICMRHVCGLWCVVRRLSLWSCGHASQDKFDGMEFGFASLLFGRSSSGVVLASDTWTDSPNTPNESSHSRRVVVIVAIVHLDNGSTQRWSDHVANAVTTLHSANAIHL